LHMGAQWNYAEILQKMGVWTTESKRVEKLLLAKDKYGIMAWHWTGEIGSLKPLEILCSLANGVD